MRTITSLLEPGPRTFELTHRISRSRMISHRPGGGQGWGNCQPMITGAVPELGLSAEDSFI